MPLFPQIDSFLKKLEVNQIAENRRQVLHLLVDYLQAKIDKNEPIRLNFICTHNSRRSHLSQVWAQTLAYYFGIKQAYCYSGGTEATALFFMVVETLQNVGFEISALTDGKNPIYSIKYAENEPAIVGFSKEMNHSFNPKTDFGAIMTCSQAEENCPLVLGAETRIALTYEDPKAFDNTPHQAEKYQERSLQIASELFYVFSKLKTNV